MCVPDTSVSAPLACSHQVPVSAAAWAYSEGSFSSCSLQLLVARCMQVYAACMLQSLPWHISMTASLPGRTRAPTSCAYVRCFPRRTNAVTPAPAARAGICGSDLHLYLGTIPNMKPGQVMGHEVRALPALLRLLLALCG